MAALTPYVRFRDLSGDTIIADSTNVADYSIEHELDLPVKISLSVPLSEPDAVPAALKAVGGSDNATYLPVLMEFGLEGSTGPIDVRHLVEHVVREPRTDGSLLRLGGDDLASLLADTIVMYQSFLDVKFQDAIAGAAGTIVPLQPSHYGISSGNTLPGVAGILRVQPGKGSWVGKPRLVFSGFFDPSIAGQATNLESYADSVLKAIQETNKLLGGVVIAGDAQPQGGRGHGVWDTSDAPLNLSAVLGLPAIGPGTTTATTTADQTVVAINCGGGAITGSPFVADTDYSGPYATVYTSTAIDLSRVTSPPPMALFQSESYQNGLVYTIPGLTAGATYKVRLFFAEITENTNGRVFNVVVNGTTIATSFCPWVAGGSLEFSASELDANTAADASGKITVSFVAVTDLPTISGIWIIYPAGSPVLGPPPTATGTALLAINCGGPAVAGTAFVADRDYDVAPQSSATANAIDLTTAAHPAPQAVYQSYAYNSPNPPTYTLPGLTPGVQYIVRTHFCELYYSTAGNRIENVVYNGTTVFSHLDTVGTPGGEYKAYSVDALATADANGHIVVSLVSVSQLPVINGIEVYAAATSSTTTTTPAASNALIVGNAGGTPYSGFAFNGSNQGAVMDETVEARVVLDGLVVDTDLSGVYSEASFLGGNSAAGFPAGYRVAALAMINTAPPGQSTNRDQWTDNLVLLGIDIGGRSGGLYFWFGDGAIRPWPNSPQLPVLSIAFDNAHAMLYIGTPLGVFSHPSSPTDTSAWVQVGSLSARVARLAMVPDASGNAVLFAHVFGDANPQRYDGIYRYPGGASTTGSDYGGWDATLLSESIIDMVVTDALTFWTITKADQGHIFRHTATATVATPVPTAYALPAGVKATSLSRVITAGTTPQDSVWAMTGGGGSPCYFLVNTSGNWGSFLAGNADGSLVGPTGQALQVNSCVGLGLTLNGVYTSVFASTNNGVYWSATLDGKGWKSLDGQNGLDGVAIQGVTGGQQQSFIGVSENVFVAANATQVFQSRSAAFFWSDLTKGKLSAGVAFSSLVYAVTGTYPHNNLRTIGPQATAPISGSAVNTTTHLSADNTHLQTTAIPASFYVERRLDGRGEWWYWVVAQGCPIYRQRAESLTQLQTNVSVPIQTASTNLLGMVLSWLGNASVPMTTVTVPSSFVTTQAALRRLRPTMLVPLTASAPSILQTNRAGAVVAVQGYSYAGVSMYVVKHSIKMGSGGGWAETETTLSTHLGPVLSPTDYAASNQYALHILKIFGNQ